MSEYFDVISFRKTKNDKTFAVKLGSAKKRDDGGFNLYLHSFPAPTDGQYLITVAPPREQGAGDARKPARELDDGAPF
jgi:hypothetical protein